MTEKRKIGIAAFVLPVALMLIIMLGVGQYPFGDNTLLIWDMDWQYSSFFVHLHDILHGDASPWYSFSRAIGGDMIGVVAYYLISPFNLVFYFIGSENVYVGIWLVMLLKIGAIGYCMNLYLYHRRQDVTTLIFSTAYALSGFIVAYIANIIWLDGIMVLPLMVLGIERLVEEKKYLLYLFTITYAVATNFYIGYMLCAFSVLYFVCYFFLISDNKKSIKTVLLYAVSSLLGGALSACVALPTLYSLQGGKSKLDIGALWNFSKMFNYRDLISASYTGMVPASQTTSGLALVYCGVFTLLLVIYYFLSRGISWKKKIAYLFMIVFLLFSLGHYNLCVVWQGFNMPAGANFRFSFLYVFVMLVVANEAGRVWKVEEKTERLLVLGIGVFLLLLPVVFHTDFQNIGRRGVLLVNLCLVVAYTAFLLLEKNTVRKKAAFIAVMSIELCVNALYLYHYSSQFESTTVTEYKSYVENTSDLVSVVKEEDGLFRTVMTGEAYRTVNDSMFHNLYGLDSYTSLERESTQLIAFDLGYYWNMIFGIHYKDGSTQAAESLLGVRYLIASEEPESGYQLLEQDGNLGLYENQNALRVAMFTSEDIKEVSNEEYNSFEYQNAIYEALCEEVEGPLLSPSRLEISRLENCEQNADGSFTVLDTQTEAYVEYQLIIEKEGYQYLQYITSEASAVIVVNSGEEVDLASQQNVVKRLGYLYPDDEIYIRCVIGGEQPRVLNKVYVYYEDGDVLSNYAQEINAQKVEVIHEREDRVTISCTNEEADTAYLLLTIPYDEGWKITIDGQKVQADTAMGNLMLLAVEPGAHVIEMRFVPQGLYEGLAVTGAVAILLIVNYLAIRMRKKKQQGEIEN